MKIKVLLVALSLLLAVPASAHSGGTDSQGGHHDYKNVSGLGSYHYHHGMGPHLHPNGVCPYSSGNAGGSYTEPESDPLDGFEYDEDRNIYYGEWGIIDEDGYFHSYEDGVFDEDGNFYLYDDLEWCIYCDGTVYPGRDHECPTYEDAPDYCYDCDNIIESSSDHDDDCPALDPKYDSPVYDEEGVAGPDEPEEDKIDRALLYSLLLLGWPLAGVPFALCYLYVTQKKKQ